jgi:hypothetical protein
VSILADEVIEELRPAGRTVESRRRVADDLEEGARRVNVLKRRLAVSQLDSRDTCKTNVVLSPKSERIVIFRTQSPSIDSIVVNVVADFDALLLAGDQLRGHPARRAHGRTALPRSISQLSEQTNGPFEFLVKIDNGAAIIFLVTLRVQSR